MSKDRILIIDFLNLFLRNFIADPSINSKGLPFGGCKGFLKSLQKLCRETKPNIIIICHDGTGGSKRKKRLFSEYKDGRKPVHLNRNVKNLSDDEEERNKNDQFLRLIEYLNLMPIIQLVIDNVEADDIIARICNIKLFNDKIKIIVSSDKDFFQLCSKGVVVLRPVQQEIMNVPRIVEKFGIHPNNFALARSITGDKSDNLDGVYGIGLKTIAKRLPFLAMEQSWTIDELFEFCNHNQKDGKVKIHSDILNNKDKIILNYKIMQLYVPNISAQNSKKIKDTLHNFIPEFNQTEVTKKFIQDGLTDYNWIEIFQIFKSIVANSKSFGT